MSLELPRPLGPFLLLRHLASGGMGDVWLAHQKLGEGERLCVVKTVRAELGRDNDDTLMLRFLDEARTTAFITHKNVASVIDVGKADGTAYMAVEHVAGRDVQSVLKKAKRMNVRIPEEVAIYVIGELLEALAYVHQAKHPRSLEHLKIVHRDVSPHNVMASYAGEVKLIDFGIARSSVKRELTQAGQAIGKVRYMSPEQARAEPVDWATDVWAASIMAVELLSGRGFWGEQPLEAILMQVAMGTKPRPPGLLELPKPLRHALKAGLNVDRTKRPSAQALKESILGASTVRGSSEALQQLLKTLFDGEEDNERKAYALLLQEPTSVQAAAGLWSRTSHEDTPAPGADDVAGDAVTASQIVGQNNGFDDDDDSVDDGSLETVAQPVRPRAVQHSTSPSAPATRTASAVNLPRKKASLTPYAAAAAAVLAVCTVVALTIILVRSGDADDVKPPPPPHVIVDADPPVDERERTRPPPPAPVIVDAVPTVIPTTTASVTTVPVTTTPVTTTPFTTTPVSATGVTTVVELNPDGTPVDTKPQHPSAGLKPRPHPTSTSAKPLLGERVRMLRQCKPNPPCAGPVLRRVLELGALSTDETKALDVDVDWCLKQCK